jgi:hypothetical protein
MIAGTTDYDRRFHPFGLLITKSELTDDFAFMFDRIKSLSKELFDLDFNPTILVADCAESITNGFKKVFKLTKRIYCWAHVKRAIEKKLNQEIKGKAYKETRYKVLLDIVNFQQNVSIHNFVEIARLMISGWDDNIPGMQSFKTYFSKQWCRPHIMGWIDHYCDWVPITNNALESLNANIKKNTFRKRMGIKQFLNVLSSSTAVAGKTKTNSATPSPNAKALPMAEKAVRCATPRCCKAPWPACRSLTKISTRWSWA